VNQKDCQTLCEVLEGAVDEAGAVDGEDDSSCTDLSDCPTLLLLSLALRISFFLSFPCLYKNIPNITHMNIMVTIREVNKLLIASITICFAVIRKQNRKCYTKLYIFFN
jgi:hypothetical protein